MKQCPRCKEQHEISCFCRDRTNVDGLNTYCRACVKEMRNDPRCRALDNASQRARYHGNVDEREARRDRKYKRNYGLSLISYNRLLADQHHKCAICGTVPFDDKHHLCVDHNHSTGVVRGLLCASCNSLIGYVHENPTRLTNAAIYLRKYA